MNKKYYFLENWHGLWSTKVFLQSLLVGFIYEFFILLGFMYQTLGLSPSGYEMMILINNIPLYPIEIVSRMCCSVSILGAKNEATGLSKIAELSLISNAMFAFLVFYILSIIFKFNIRTPKLVFLSIIIWILSLIFIDLLAYLQLVLL